MNYKFDELTKSMAQSVTRRGALKKFGLGVAGLALAALGMPNKAEADSPACLPLGYTCSHPDTPDKKCCSGYCAAYSGGFGRVKRGICGLSPY